jgi:Holliday junction DNA helicase RuvA
MIAFVSGTVHKKEMKSLLIDVQGIGYEILCPGRVLSTANEKKHIFLYTYHHVREDEMTLFGFLQQHDLEFFKKLISVSGIGPKIALDIMGVPTNLLLTALEKGDIDFLKSVKGVGKKTAERMVVELRGNIPLMDTFSSSLPPEVVETLSQLGFSRSMIHTGFQEMKSPFPPSEEMVKWFLKKVGS